MVGKSFRWQIYSSNVKVQIFNYLNLHNSNIMERCIYLQESTPFCKKGTLTIIWHFRKFLPGNGMWIRAFRTL